MRLSLLTTLLGTALLTAAVQAAGDPREQDRRMAASSALTTAVYSGDQAAVETAIKAGAYLTGALQTAAEHGYLNIVKSLVEHGANVNDRIQMINQLFDYWTALMAASNKGYFNIVTYLVEHGADVNIKSQKGETAFTLALRGNFKDIENYLKLHGARY